MSSIIHENSNSPRSDTSKSNIHIVIDNSNLFIGAQVGQGEDGKLNASIRISIGNLVNIIEENIEVHNIKTRIVGGSVPSRNARVWAEWKKCQYECLLGERSISNKEVFVDDMLHSQIQNLILKNKSSEDCKQHLILITGDGGKNGKRTNFPNIISLALNNKWTVDLWSWKASLSREFANIKKRHSPNMKINYLDTYRTEITFQEKQKQGQQDREQEQQNQQEQDQQDQEQEQQNQQEQQHEQQNQQEQDQKIKKKRKKKKKKNKIKIDKNDSNENNKMIYIYILWLILPLVILICSVIFIVFF
ncbi:unnamed protein product [Adineta steineri]|uniref:Uncharacterized protein n=2 Tax=Adineta steineri TaxID=433720 RepID=A0A819EBG0_9BILA|nr:unnamed protein product [Adineta steineri]CAF3847965.1 unnamed protein product [Adineta steineri]